ncbi:PspC domain-containing protein [Amycolatopsis sp., V23-08]|uniref:PspC domain-containing protein n=1 Tax=Amycolatopsis heterodermiae TaxID=3110235 RepID=A0ABU5R7F0_9PSEU|nr:PspC domain-containing protein [Amycolatopsis sp., V23-08]MEA5362141.1 PspC domain-containing protein [Amycolatopsis sp., V23-08]
MTMDGVQESLDQVVVPETVTQAVTVPPSPKMFRRRSGRAIAGVAGGLADHLGVPVVWVRTGFALLAALNGAGLLAYGLLWVFVQQQTEETAKAPTSKERQQAFGLIALGVGLAVASGTLTGFISGWVAVPLAIAMIGLAVVWREADESQRRRWRVGAKDGFAGAFLGGGGWSAAIRIVAGVALVITGIGVVVLRSGSLDQVQFALIAVIATLIGVAVLTIPFWLRLVRDLSDERKARIRTDERAEIAAHLHDSVLQTLALIQKQSEQPREVARLARSQERELRGWLYGPNGYGKPVEKPEEAQTTGQLSEALATACGEVEDTFAISVGQVVVGDAELDESLVALVQAAREAIVNAAKHAGVEEVSVYAEVEPTSVTVFVRDRGKGFDPDVVPGDRHGLADSIRGRMTRHGGTCKLRTAPGEGTEVQLAMPVKAGKGAV